MGSGKKAIKKSEANRRDTRIRKAQQARKIVPQEQA